MVEEEAGDYVVPKLISPTDLNFTSSSFIRCRVNVLLLLLLRVKGITFRDGLNSDFS